MNRAVGNGRLRRRHGRRVNDGHRYAWYRQSDEAQKIFHDTGPESLAANWRLAYRKTIVPLSTHAPRPYRAGDASSHRYRTDTVAGGIAPSHGHAMLVLNSCARAAGPHAAVTSFAFRQTACLSTGFPGHPPKLQRKASRNWVRNRQCEASARRPTKNGHCPQACTEDTHNRRGKLLRRMTLRSSASVVPPVQSVTTA